MKLIRFNAVLLGAILLASSGIAQTTLPGNSDVDGSFAVGNSTNKGGLTVTGQTGNTATTGIKVTGDGGVLFEGTYGAGQIPAVGAGTRFMWHPKKAALRVGRITSTHWDESNIGNDSIALGRSTKASGQDAMAFGLGANAGGAFSLALAGGVSLGEMSVAIGLYPYITAPATASGLAAVAIGGFSQATGFQSFASPFGVADGSISLAMAGGWSTGEQSVAVGWGAVTVGSYSSSMGYNVTSYAAYSTALGVNCAVEGDPLNWVDSDPLLVIGNGTGNHLDAPEVRNRNAVVIRKNGNIEIAAKITMPRQGDILMGEFGNPE